MSKPALIRQSVIYVNQDTGVTITKGLWDNEPVAIKEELFASLAESNTAIKESLNMMRLKHPAVCKVYDCEITQENGLYKSIIVVELLESDLNRQITLRSSANNPWSEHELIEYLVTLVGALSYSQKEGVAHRDIKPHNIFCSNDGKVVKIGDFGCASKLKQQGDQSQTIAGSPFYLSPQLKHMYIQSLRGYSHGQYNPFKSDVYSLGVVFLYLAHLRAPLELLKLDILQHTTENLLQEIAGYTVLCRFLRRMLEVDEPRRCDFIELEAELQQAIPPRPSAGPIPTDPTAISMDHLRLINSQAMPIPAAYYSQPPVYFQPAAYPPAQYHQQYQYPVYEVPAYQQIPMVNSQYMQGGYRPQSLPAGYYQPPVNVVQPAVTPQYYPPPHSLPANSSSPASLQGVSFCRKCKTPFLDPSKTKLFCSTGCQPAASPKPVVESAKQQEPPARAPRPSPPPGEPTCINCPVNLTPEQNAVKLSCGHSFHDDDCLFEYMRKEMHEFTVQRELVCPICREPVTTEFVEKRLTKDGLETRKRVVEGKVCCVCGCECIVKSLQSCEHKVCMVHDRTDVVCSFCAKK